MNIIVAVDSNWAIGKDNSLLVSIPSDHKFFREMTTGKVVVLGRKTLETFPNGLPLKNRTNIILSTDPAYQVKDALVVHSVDELLEACRYYAEKTRRRISFEYAVIEGVNDSKACAEELAHKLRGMLCHINLIPLNRIEERAFVSGRESAERFQRALGEGLSVTIRRTLGSDIEAACGQLRRAEASAGQTNR